jgi:hypothetical protein
MLCISRPFRTAFFAEPQEKAESLVGTLRDDEIEQILWLAGDGETLGLTRDAFRDRLQGALDQVWAAIDCPDPPCPGNPLASSMI